MKYALLFLLATAFSFSACDKDTQADEDALIQAYIKENNLSAIKAEEGLYYVVEQEGTGQKPAGVYSEVTVHYTGYLLKNKQVFDSSRGRGPFTSTLTRVIKGWQYGIPKFKVGGKGKLLIPSHLAYGERGSGRIPANAPLVFDIELLAVQN